ncbi:MAG: zf-HC2 domain-containing protein [Vicinamibacterales bacterium]
MLTCRELTELVTNYLEGRLSLAERVKFEMHLAMCRHCRAYVQQMRETIQTLGKLPEERVSQEACTHLLDRFRNWKQQ